MFADKINKIPKKLFGIISPSEYLRVSNEEIIESFEKGVKMSQEFLKSTYTERRTRLNDPVPTSLSFNVEPLSEAAVAMLFPESKYPQHIKRTFHMFPEIVDIKFNGPATIIFWENGKKTVVKCCEDDEFDYEKGIAMAILIEALGKSGVKKLFKKYIPEEEVVESQLSKDAKKFFKGVHELHKKSKALSDELKKTYGGNKNERSSI